MCTIVLGNSTGFGTFYGLIGGVASVGNVAGGTPQGYFQTGNFGLHVLAGLPSSIGIVTGNNQAGNPGQALATPLIATVLDTTGNLLSGQQVVWSVTPANSATLSNTTTTSDVNGRVQTNVSLASSAAGQVQVKVALQSNPNISTTFTITANVQLTGLQILSGNNQTALINAPFTQPLVVQVNAANGQAAVGIPVSFAVSGPATLSANTVSSDSNGRASVIVTASATTGAVTVVASSGLQSILQPERDSARSHAHPEQLL